MIFNEFQLVVMDVLEFTNNDKEALNEVILQYFVHLLNKDFKITAERLRAINLSQPNLVSQIYVSVSLSEYKVFQCSLINNLL